MKKDINIIVIDDDKSQLDRAKYTLDMFNEREADYFFKEHLLLNKNGLLELLFDRRIDAIIIDLDWGTLPSEDSEVDGFQLIQQLYQKTRIPIIVFSGNLARLDSTFEESAIFKKFNRDKSFEDVLNVIKSIYQTGYTSALGNNGAIDIHISDIFWKYFTTNLDEWMYVPERQQSRSLLRYMINKISEKMSFAEDGSFDNYNTIEIYTNPPIREDLFTGDIVFKTENPEVFFYVITPACDIANGKADFLTLCSISHEYIQTTKDLIKNGSNNPDKLKEYTNNKIDRYHLLPPSRLFIGGLIDFQKIESVNVDAIKENYTVKASVNVHFSKDIISRFSKYYGKQGQPQLDVNEIVKIMRRL